VGLLFGQIRFQLKKKKNARTVSGASAVVLC
jgi:hypothetical protein